MEQASVIVRPHSCTRTNIFIHTHTFTHTHARTHARPCARRGEKRSAQAHADQACVRTHRVNRKDLQGRVWMMGGWFEPVEEVIMWGTKAEMVA